MYSTYNGGSTGFKPTRSYFYTFIATSSTIGQVGQDLLLGAYGGTHVQASNINVAFSTSESNLTVTQYLDNGRGFELGSAEPQVGLALKNIQSRIKYLNGSIDINSVDGFRCTIQVPLSNEKV